MLSVSSSATPSSPLTGCHLPLCWGRSGFQYATVVLVMEPIHVHAATDLRSDGQAPASELLAPICFIVRKPGMTKSNYQDRCRNEQSRSRNT